MNFTLNTGQQVPAIGFGTWKITPDKAAKEAVLQALALGYRLIDTAHIYGNERGVGEAIRESGIPREDIFVTTKLWNDDQGYEQTLKAFEVSMDKLGLDYLDLYLVHWPATSRRFDTWRAFEKLIADGRIKAAGVSNFTADHLEELAERSDLVPAVNQVEFHPFIYDEQQAVLDYCDEQDILIEGYSPLNRLGHDVPPVLRQIADQLEKTPQQVVLRWCIEQGVLPLPRSTNEEHIRSNFDIFDFELDDTVLRALNSLSDGQRVTWDPAGMG